MFTQFATQGILLFLLCLFRVHVSTKGKSLRWVYSGKTTQVTKKQLITKLNSLAILCFSDNTSEFLLTELISRGKKSRLVLL